jgi:hypothetical protein
MSQHTQTALFEYKPRGKYVIIFGFKTGHYTSTPQYIPTVLFKYRWDGTMKYKVVFVLFVLVVGPISTAAMKAYFTLTLMEFRHLSPEALHTKRLERPLLAKDGNP